MRPLSLAAGLTLFGAWTMAMRSGAPPSSTGAPISTLLSEQTCSQVFCHEGSPVNSGSGTLSVQLPDTYTPGQALRMTVKLEENDRSRFGFQVAAKAGPDAAGLYAHAGRFSLVDPDRTQIRNDYYVTHTQAGTDQGQWEVEWTPGPGETRPVKFYVAANAANGNNEPTGDHIYTATDSIKSVHATATANTIQSSIPDVGVPYPNPFFERTHLTYTLGRPSEVHLALYDSQGRLRRTLISAYQSAGGHNATIQSQGLPSGVYFLRFRTPQVSLVRTVTLVQ